MKTLFVLPQSVSSYVYRMMHMSAPALTASYWDCGEYQSPQSVVMLLKKGKRKRPENCQESNKSQAKATEDPKSKSVCVQTYEA